MLAKFCRGRGETAGTGGLTPRTVGFIRLTANWMFGKCVHTHIFAANKLANNSPPETRVNIVPGTQIQESLSALS